MTFWWTGSRPWGPPVLTGLRRGPHAAAPSVCRRVDPVAAFGHPAPAPPSPSGAIDEKPGASRPGALMDLILPGEKGEERPRHLRKCGPYIAGHPQPTVLVETGDWRGEGGGGVDVEEIARGDSAGFPVGGDDPVHRLSQFCRGGELLVRDVGRPVH